MEMLGIIGEICNSPPAVPVLKWNWDGLAVLFIIYRVACGVLRKYNHGPNA